jgi:hypothetical protein
MRASADLLKQKEILESYITQRVDGIAISSLNGEFLADTISAHRRPYSGDRLGLRRADVETHRLLRRRRSTPAASWAKAIKLGGKGKVALI